MKDEMQCYSLSFRSFDCAPRSTCPLQGACPRLLCAGVRSPLPSVGDFAGTLQDRLHPFFNAMSDRNSKAMFEARIAVMSP